MKKKVETRAVDIDEIMSSLDDSGSDTNIVILDACRNNPLPAGSGRSASRGLSIISKKPKNSIIVYSAEAGTVAQDGLFTPALTTILNLPGLSLSDVLLQVRQDVYKKSQGLQIPGEYNQLFQNIYLKNNDINLINPSIVANKIGENEQSSVDILDFKEKLADLEGSRDYLQLIKYITNSIFMDNEDVLKSLAEAYGKSNDYKNAIRTYDKLIKIDGTSSWYYLQRGVNYFNYSFFKNVGLYKEAISNYTKAIELDKNNYFAYLSRSQSYRCINNFEAALMDCNSASLIEPDNDYTLHEKAFVLVGLKKYEELNLILDKIVSLMNVKNPNSFFYNCDKGEEYFYIGDWYSFFNLEKAKMYYKKSADFGNSYAKDKLKKLTTG